MDWLDQGSSRALDVAALLDGKAGTLIYEVVATGALVSLGLTADGGALGITVTVDGRWRREYFREAEDIETWVASGLADIDAAVTASRAARASSGQRKRSRAL